MPRRVRPGRIHIPREKNTNYSINIDEVDVTSDVISAEFTNSIIGFESPCKITLIDSDGDYAEKYTGGEVIELKLDFSSGRTSVWKGTLETPRKKFGDAFTLEVVGSSYQTDLLDITVTESYLANRTVDDILKEITDTYLSGFTYGNVDSFSVKPTINWDNKPFWDCVVDLCELAEADAYVDTDKDIHFFSKESVAITKDEIVWNDNLLEIEKFGTDSLDVKNRIIVNGETEKGNPIVYQADDSTSQDSFGIKEKVIKDTSIKTYEQARDLGEAELALQKDTSNKGIFRCIILPDVTQGGMIFISDPIQKIYGSFRVVQYTHFLPNELTKVVVAKDKTIPTIFKDRKKAEISLQKIVNPNKMKFTWTFFFDNLTELSGFDSNIIVSDSKLFLSTGTEGIATSNLRTEISEVTEVHLIVLGEATDTTDFRFSTKDGASGSYKSLTQNGLTVLSDPGKNLKLEIRIKSASTRIDEIILLYK